MQAFCPVMLCLLLSLAATPAQAQTSGSDAPVPNPGAIGSSLSEILALTTLGTVTTQEQAVEVTRSGGNYLVRLPLRGFSTPANAAIDAVARPLDGGIFDISSLTFPASGTVASALPGLGINEVTYSIGVQTISAHLDPTFAQPSSFTANLGDFRLRSEQAETHSEQVVDHYHVSGTLTSEPSGGLGFSTAAKATNWHLKAHRPDGVDTDGLVRAASGHFSIDGLDRLQGTRLLGAIHGLMAGAPSPVPGQPPLPFSQTQALRDVVDAASGLLNSLQAAETLEDIHFAVGSATSGTVRRVQVEMTGEAAAGRVNARMDIGMDDPVISSVSAETAALVPRHIAIKSALRNVQAGPLIALLRAATAQDSDPAAVRAQLIALLRDPPSRFGIESLAFDSGVLGVTGSLRVLPRVDGQIGADIHLSATGMDALLVQAQGNPAMQQALPMILIAKGLGRPEGDAMIWDITVGGGPITVNGVPFGQPAASNR
jgi:hypothetical protein